jgi:hypothetical protein
MDKITFAAAQDSIKYFSYVELQRLKNHVDEQVSKDRVGQAIAGEKIKFPPAPTAKGKALCDGGVTVKGIKDTALKAATSHSVH